MKFQSLMLAACAVPAIVACPLNIPTRTTTVLVTVTPGPNGVVIVEPTHAPAPLPTGQVQVPPPIKAPDVLPQDNKNIAQKPKTTTRVPVPPPVATPKPQKPEVPEKVVPAPAPVSNGPRVSGKSTFYGGNVGGGTCSFTGYTIPAGLYGVAFSGSAWNNGANCGGCVRVTGPNGKSITAMVVDQCPECEESHLDLFQNGFAQIGSISAGIIQTSYTFVDCGISSPIVLKNKSGTSPYWFSMQVVNASERVSKLEVSTDGGKTWKGTQRQEYNFFEQASGFGTGQVDVKVTSISGKTVVVKGVKVASDSATTAASNF